MLTAIRRVSSAVSTFAWRQRGKHCRLAPRSFAMYGATFICRQGREAQHQHTRKE
jgi:hypothetical protein